MYAIRSYYESNEAKLAAAEKAADAAAEAEVDTAPSRDRDDLKVDMPEPAAPKPSIAEEKVEPVSHTETSAGIDPRNAPNALPLAKLQVLSGSFAGRELELTRNNFV